MIPVEQRIHAKISEIPAGHSTACWIWNGAICGGGYARVSYEGKNRRAHRVAYELWVAKIPEGLVIDHLCRNRRCVNPAHMEAVEHVENVRRGHVGAHHKAKTHCPSGHAYTPENTQLWHGRRYCRTCHRQSNQKWRRARR